eukprot:jgi/Orpsp1_1/1191078/evm.model.d7180000083328.1
MNILVTQILFLLAVVSSFSFSFSNEIFKKGKHDAEEELLKTLDLYTIDITTE